MNMNSNIWGFLFIIFGLVLILIMYGMVSVDMFKDWWRLWPSVFIIIGIIMLVFRNEERKIEGVKK